LVIIELLYNFAKKNLNMTNQNEELKVILEKIAKSNRKSIKIDATYDSVKNELIKLGHIVEEQYDDQWKILINKNNI